MNTYLIEPNGYIAGDTYVPQAMVRESNGKLWYSCQNDDVDDTVLYYSTDDGQTWTRDTDFPGGNSIPNNESSLRHSAITIDQNDILHIVFYVYKDNRDSEIYYTKRESGSWSAPVKISTDTGIDLAWFGITICVDSNSEVHAAWDFEDLSHVMHIMYNYTENGVWQGETNLTQNGSYDSYEALLRCDDDDNVHLMYVGEGYGDYLGSLNIKYRKKTSGVWGSIHHVTNLNVDFQIQDMFIDDNDVVHLMYHQLGTGGNSYYQYYDGSWHDPEAIDDGFSFGGFTSGSNRDTIGYVYKATTGIGYKERLGVDSWSDEIILIASDSSPIVGGLFSYVPIVSGRRTNLPNAGINFTKLTGSEIYFVTSTDWEVAREYPIIFYDTVRTQDSEEQPITFSDRTDVEPELPVVFYERIQ